MPKIDQFRARPEFAGLPDDVIVKALAIQYPDASEAQIASDLGVNMAPAVAPNGRSLGSTAKDLGLGVMSGAVAIPESLVGLADMASSGAAGKVIENAGIDFKGAHQYWNDKTSPELKAANQKVEQAEGFGGKLAAALENPSTIAQSVAESLPAMALSGVAARGMMSVGSGVVGAAGPQLPGALARAVGSVQKAAGISGALGEGITMAGQDAEQIRQETGTLTPSQTLDAAAIGAAGAGFAMLGASVARKLGIHDVDTMIAAGHANPAAAKGIVRRVLEGAFSEGILEELPQSVVEQVLQNKAMGKPLEEGVDQAAVMGMLAGGAMGAGGNVIGGHTQHMPPPAAPPAPIPGSPLTTAAQVGATAQAAGVPTADPAKLTEAVDKAVKAGAEQPDPQEAQDRALNLEKIAAGVEPQPVHPLDEQASDAQWDHDAQVYADATGGAAVPPGGAPGTAASKRADYDDSGLPAITPGTVDEAAHGAATSPTNALAEPTRGQAEAGNYKVGRVKVAGLDISIENPAGSVREDKANTPPKWSTTMQDHYGYIRKTEAADGDHLDTYVRKGTPPDYAGPVYVVDQINQHDDSYDEAKVMLGYANRGAAVRGYKGHYTAGWKMGRVTEMSMDQFKDWIKTGDTTKPASPKGALVAPDLLDQPTPAKKESGTAAEIAERLRAEHDAKDAKDAKRARLTNRDAEHELLLNVMGREEDAASWDMSTDELLGQATAEQHMEYRRRLHERRAAAIQSLNNITGATNATSTQPPAGAQAPDAGEPAAAAPAPAGTPAAGSTAVQAAGLTVTFDGKDFPVASVEEAQAKWHEFRQAAAQNGGGASDIGNGVPVMQGGKPIGRISYNGRFHPAGDANASSSTAPAPDAGRQDTQRADGADVPASDGAAAPVAAVASSPAAPAPAVAAPAPAAVAESKPAQETPAARWTRMTATEREALITQRTAAKKPAQIASRSWEDLHPSWHKTIERALKEHDTAAPVKEAKAPAAPAPSPAPAPAPAARPTVLHEGKGGTVYDEEAIQRRNLAGVKLGGVSADALGEHANLFEQALERDAKASFDAAGNFIGQPYRFVPSRGGNGAGIRMFGDLAEAKAFADSYGQKTTPPAPPRKRLGKGDRGQTIFENEQGVRSYTESGFKYEEEPGKPRADAFKTEAELAQKPAPGAGSAPAAAPSADTLRAQADLSNALADLGDLLGRPFKANIVPEQEAKLVPILTRVLDAAFRLGYHKFKDAAKFALDTIREKLGGDIADAITLEHLQGSYIAMSGGKAGADKIGAVGQVTDKAELEAHTAATYTPEPEKTDNGSATTTNEAPDEQGNQPAVGAGDSPAGDGARGQRGTRAQQPAAQLDLGGMEAGQPGDVGAPGGGKAGSTAGQGAAGPDVGPAGGPAQGGSAGNRRTRAGGKGNSDAGAGGRGARATAGAGDAAGGQRAGVAPESPAAPPPGDFHIADPLKIVGGGQVARFEKNKRAIDLRNTLVESGRKPTPEEQEVLAGYTGWGSFGQELFQGNWSKAAPKAGWEERDQWLRDNLGQKEWEGLQTSIINAHYTDPPTVLAMWDMVKRMGFTGGRVLEPSIGIGNFFGMQPVDLASRSQRAGIELDPVTGSMAQMLYPSANIQIKGYEQSTTPDNFYDLVIGNWPFSEISPADRKYNRLSPTLHDYFFLKAIDQTKPGGLVVGITTKGTMDKKGVNARMEMARKAELVAAFRLPSGAFEEYAGTKVVTDIIILRKRDQPIGIVDKEGWIDVRDHDTKEGTKVPVNEYFHRNPSHVIGTIDFGHGTTTFRPGLIVHRPADMMEQLRRIVDLVPEGAFQAKAPVKHISYVANHTSDRTNALVKSPQGLFIVAGEYLAPANEVAKYELKDPAKTAVRVAQLEALVDMRKLYGSLIDAERAGDATAPRTALRTAYEAFVKAHGTLSESFGLGYLRKIDDPFYPSLAGLEIRGADDKYRPAGILTASTMRGKRSMDNPNVTDAFVLARGESVNPSLERIAELAKKTPAEVRTELVASGAGFELPNGDFAPADVYLSGNVREKMREAKAALTDGNAAMKGNIEALAKVIPADIPYYKIETQMGATWVPPQHYTSFVAHMLGLENPTDPADIKARNTIEVSFQGGSWKVNFDGALNHRPQASSGFGVAAVKFKRLVRAAIANQTVTVKYKVEGVEHVDAEATAEANSKIAEMRQKFGEWLWKDPSRRVALESEYNEVRNAYATPSFDGSFLGFQGMALTLGRGPFNLRQHQVNAIWRALVTRKSLNAHEVGTGKTFTMGGIAVESRRYGIAKKPMLFAHNANSKSVASEIQQMYPGAKVLYIDNLSGENVKTRMMQIANDDWDVVVMPHSLIDNIGFKRETLEGMAAEEIRDLEIAAEDAAADDGVTIDSAMWDDEEELAKLRSPTAKQLVKQRMKIRATIDKLAQQASKENSIAFEDLGVDMVMVDEAHEFKKPPIATKMKLKGLQTSTSNRSISMMFLTKYIRAQNNGGNVHLFTGTPITNTMTEVFHMMRYMMQEEMSAAALADWDGWFGSFAREVEDVELNSTGEYEAVTRLQAFINVPELRRMIGQYMDVVFAEDMPEMQLRTVNGKRLTDRDITDEDRAEIFNGRTENAEDRPYKKVVNESEDMSPEQQEVFRQVQAWANSWRNMSKKDRKDAMSRGAPESPIIHDGIAARASFDVRLVDAIANAGKEGSEEMAPHPKSKPARVHNNLLSVYHADPRTTQVVFMEQGMSTSVTRREGPPGNKRDVRYPAFSTVKDMIERLVAAGVPREQIALVDGSTSKDKRKEVADAMNTGRIRIVFGSTDSLGVGVNMQKNLRAMHHMDAPWMPGELEQRNGRGHRQGNQWNTVMEFRYLTDRLDGRRWQVLAIKQRFITDFMKSKGDVRVIEGDAASDEGGDILSTFSEAAGDPRVLLKVKFKKKLEQLQSRERMHTQAIVDAQDDIRRYSQGTARTERRIKDLKDAGTLDKLASVVDRTAGDGFAITIGGKVFTDRKEAGDALKAWATENMRQGDDKEVGEFGGEPLYANWEHKWQDRPSLYMRFGNGVEPVADVSIGSLESSLRHERKTLLPKLEHSLAEQNERKAHAEKVAQEPFHMAEQLKQAEQQLKDVEADLARNPVAPPYWLRTGAPTDTTVLYNGKEFVVSGHRWSDQGWFVLGRDDKGEVSIPYMEATDSQSMPLYEEREFEPPRIQTANGAAAANNANPPGFYLVTDPDGIEEDGPRELSADDIKQLLGHGYTIAPATPGVRFRQPDSATSTAPANAQHVGELQQVVDAIRAGWKRAPAIEVLPSIASAGTPREVLAEARKVIAAGGAIPNGVIHVDPKRGPVVYLFADRIADKAEAATVVFHEVLGHYGLRGVFGDELNAILRQVAQARRADVSRIIKRNGFAETDRLRAAEELLAHMAETAPSLGFVRRAVAAIKQFLRSIGVMDGAAMSDDEIIRSFILPARRWVETGGKPAPGAGSVSFSQGERGLRTVQVDGVRRPDSNSQGQVIYPMTNGMQGLVNFWRWFSPGPKSLLADVSQSRVDGLKRDVQQLADFLEGEAVRSHAGGKVDVPVAMLRAVVGVAGVHPEIARAVVRAVPADVVNLLGGSQAAAEKALHDESVLKDRLSSKGQDDVALAGDTARNALLAMRVVVRAGAEVTGLTGRALEANAAVLARQLDSVSGGHAAIMAGVGDSKVVDDKGRPLVVYHGTTADFDTFDAKKAPQGLHFGTSRAASERFDSLGNGDEDYVRPDGGDRILPVYLSIKNPMMVDDFGGDTARWEDAIQRAKDAGHDGLAYANDYEDKGSRSYVAFRPEQIKSATGNAGTFDAGSSDIRFSQGSTGLNDPRDFYAAAMDRFAEYRSTPGKLNWWQKTFGTPYDLAQRHPTTFGRVYNKVQEFLRDVSQYATEAADMAPRILPKLDTWKDWKKAPISAEDSKALTAPVFEGTLAYSRDERGLPVRVKELEDRYAGLTVHDKAKMLLQRRIVTEDQLHRWEASQIDVYEGAVNNRFEQEFLAPGIVFKDEELRSLYNLTPQQIGLYRESLAGAHKSLTHLALSDMVRYGGKQLEPIADQIMGAKTLTEAGDLARDYLLTLGEPGTKESAALTDMASTIVAKGQRAQRLIDKGYFPLSRFGKYTVDVVDKDGERVYFGLFEDRMEARRMAAKMRGQFPGSTVRRGTTSQHGFELFKGLTPETAELFGEMLGLEADGDGRANLAFQKFLKDAKASRSAMKRLIERKGIAGFSEDVGRVLAGFIYSNARQTSHNLHTKEIGERVNEIPQGQGEIKDAAIKLQQYVMEPQEEATGLRNVLFAQYLGGSLAAMMVNMTQPFAVTAPYLTQFGSIARVGAAMKGALRDVWKATTGDKALDDALKHATERGIVAPQEVHQLMKQGQGKATLVSGDGTRMGNAMATGRNLFGRALFAWGQPFAVAELFNRRITFIAAYRLAVEKGIANPAGFAEKAINETQFVYNKGNKPAWARGAVGSVLFTFKQYSVSYLELVHRMATTGGPEGKKAAMLMLGMLMLMGGAGGLPFVDDISDLIDGAGQRLGYNLRTKHARQAFLEGLLGQTLGGIVDRGVTGLPGMPVDVSGRFGMGNIIPGTGLLTKKKDHTRDVVELLGPAGDLASRAFQGANQAMDGRPVTGALNAAPKAFGNLAKAYDMATLGYYPDASGKKVVDTDTADVFAKAIGFQPVGVARVQEATRDIQQLVSFTQMKESEIADKWAMGVFKGDAAATQSAKDELAAWNRDNPSTPIRIKPQQLTSRLRQMRMSKEDRVIKSAPKEIRKAAAEELRASK